MSYTEFMFVQQHDKQAVARVANAQLRQLKSATLFLMRFCRTVEDRATIRAIADKTERELKEFVTARYKIHFQPKIFGYHSYHGRLRCDCCLQKHGKEHLADCILGPGTQKKENES
jgi:hypothetical protein